MSPQDGFHVASTEEIRAGRVADVSLAHADQILREEGRAPQVVAEVRAAALPDAWPWALLAGLDEVQALLVGRRVDVLALPECGLLFAEEPVLSISGSYLEFAGLEAALLGLLCQASGIATAAARCKRAAAGRPVFSFGARRMHPAIAPMVERAAYIGGCDGVAGVAGAKLVGVEPVGTMSHALILILGEERAWRGIDRILDAKTPRIALVDTFQDEKFGAVAAARVLGERLSAVRLDTPASRRGDLPAILREVRWELDHRGFDKVNLFITGGLDDREIQRLNPFADGYGVGTSISNAPVVDFALDIVEVDGHPRAKRGKLSGRKDLWLCPECGNRGISPAARRAGHCPQCGHRLRSLLEPLIADGRPKGPAPRPRELRERALREVSAAPDPFAAQA